MKQVILNNKKYNYWIFEDGTIINKKNRKLIPFLRGNRSGIYPTVDLYSNGKRVRIDVHRLVALHYVPNPENKKEVNHKNKNRMDFSASNLEWMTRSENMIHRYREAI